MKVQLTVTIEMTPAQVREWAWLSLTDNPEEIPVTQLGGMVADDVTAYFRTLLTDSPLLHRVAEVTVKTAQAVR